MNQRKLRKRSPKKPKENKKMKIGNNAKDKPETDDVDVNDNVRYNIETGA
jgi:hypothetical protein